GSVTLHSPRRRGTGARAPHLFPVTLALRRAGRETVAEKHDRRPLLPPRRFHALLPPEARRLLRRGIGRLRFHSAPDADPSACSGGDARSGPRPAGPPGSACG